MGFANTLQTDDFHNVRAVPSLIDARTIVLVGGAMMRQNEVPFEDRKFTNISSADSSFLLLGNVYVRERQCIVRTFGEKMKEGKDVGTLRGT